LNRKFCSLRLAPEEHAVVAEADVVNDVGIERFIFKMVGVCR